MILSDEVSGSFFDEIRATPKGGVIDLHVRSSGFVLRFSGSELSSLTSEIKNPHITCVY